MRAIVLDVSVGTEEHAGGIMCSFDEDCARYIGQTIEVQHMFTDCLRWYTLKGKSTIKPEVIFHKNWLEFVQ